MLIYFHLLPTTQCECFCECVLFCFSSTKWLRVILVCCSISVFFLRAFLVCLYSLSTSRVPGEKRQLPHIFALEKFRCANVNKGDAKICRRGLICLFVYRLLYSLHFSLFSWWCVAVVVINSSSISSSIVYITTQLRVYVCG